VIGGASGAMPPVLGWAALRGEVGPEALMLCLIIFLWTPPHFWALALYRPRTTAAPACRCCRSRTATSSPACRSALHLRAVRRTLLPFVYGMSGWIYLLAAARAGRRLLRLRVRAVAPLQRGAGAPHLPLLDLAPVAAVRGAAAGPLPDRCCARVTDDRWTDADCCHLRSLALSSSPRAAASARGSPRRPFKAVDITGADYGRELALTDVDGRVRTLADFKGKAVVVFFGFTHCPDVCPTTMAELAEVKRRSAPTASGCRRCSSPSTRARHAETAQEPT
jgi:hypothetical protein